MHGDANETGGCQPGGAFGTDLQQGFCIRIPQPVVEAITLWLSRHAVLKVCCRPTANGSLCSPKFKIHTSGGLLLFLYFSKTALLCIRKLDVSNLLFWFSVNTSSIMTSKHKQGVRLCPFLSADGGCSSALIGRAEPRFSRRGHGRLHRPTPSFKRTFFLRNQTILQFDT